MQNILLLIKLNTQPEDGSYEFLLAVSTDTLIVINKELEWVEKIVVGNDYEGTILQADDEDSFLNAISVIKTMLMIGENPLLLL